MYLMSVIQFNSALFQMREELAGRGFLNLTIPQEKPRCGGEVGSADPRMHIGSAAT
jgi:hypothetical protein